MKYTTIYLENNKIEIHNSLFGKETIKVDGQVVSSKYSMFGANHHFSIKENDELNHYQIQISLGIQGVLYDLYKNGKPIIESEKGGCLNIFLIMLLIGFTVGILKALHFL